MPLDFSCGMSTWHGGAHGFQYSGSPIQSVSSTLFSTLMELRKFLRNQQPLLMMASSNTTGILSLLHMSGLPRLEPRFGHFVLYGLEPTSGQMNM